LKDDLLSIIRKSNNLSHVYILTHNIDNFFVQNSLLPVLGKCGNPNLTIFSDANCAIETYQSQYELLSGIGTRYRVVPVFVRFPFRFHPKIVLLWGKEKGEVFIGSGNLTFGGWKQNAELWSYYTSDDADNPFQNCYEYLRNIVNEIPLKDIILRELDSCWDENNFPWISKLSKSNNVIIKHGTSESIISQIKEKVGDQFIEKLYICSPYFDKKGVMIQKFLDDFDVKSIDILFQNKRCTLKEDVVESLPDNICVCPIKFKSEDITNHFIHSKWYAFESDEEVLFFLGSANCSIAALDLNYGNSESLIFFKLSKDDFQTLIMSEIEILNTNIEYTSLDENDNNATESGTIEIQACRLENFDLFVVFSSSKGIMLKECCVNNLSVEFIQKGKNELVAKCPNNPVYVQLKGQQSDQEILSHKMWIDIEDSLLHSASKRSFVNKLIDKKSTFESKFTDWKDVMNIFIDHLEHSSSWGSNYYSNHQKDNDENKTITFKASDVFRDDYGLPTLHSANNLSVYNSNDNNMIKLILEWFGVKEHIDPKDESELDEAENESEMLPDIKPESELEPSLTKANSIQKSSKRIINKIVETIIQTEYIMNRHLKQLGLDLRIIPLILSKSVQNDWITANDFFDSTHRLWSELFFASTSSIKSDKMTGLLEDRYISTPNQNKFVTELSSLEISASLAYWAFCIIDNNQSQEYSLFRLSMVYSVSLFPWLWGVNDPNGVGKKLKEILFRTSNSEITTVYTKRIQQQWKLVIQQGIVLKQFRDIVSDYHLQDLVKILNFENIQEGELLWQGKLGFSVAIESVNMERPKADIHIYCLQSKAKKNLKVSFIAPVKAILESEIIKEKMSETEIKVLKDFIDDIYVNLNDTSQ